MRSAASRRLAAALTIIVAAVGGAAVAITVAAVGGAAGADDGADQRRAFDRRGTTLTTATRATLSRALQPARTAANWCGTPSAVDTTPNAVAGHPIHWVYVIPSDGEDRFSTFASTMQTDAETLTAWWRSQDPARAPRADSAPFACGIQLDISSVRARESGSALSARPTPFSLLANALFARGFNSPFAKYVIYYDGPVGDNMICGTGSSNIGGPGMAMVFVRACPGISTDEVAAHELLHSMGAVPRGAPNLCPEPDGAHVCGNARDLMNPFTDGTPLAGMLLDPGRDDYYGHSGSWPDLQDSPWLVNLERQTSFSLTVTGPGRVASDVPGIDCVQSCSTTWNDGTRLGLSPVANPGAKLVRWSGGCTGSGPCSVTVAQGASVTAFFAPSTYRLQVRVSGRGSVRGSSAGIACPPRCGSNVASHAQLRLSATPAKGWKLKTWRGGCLGKKLVCALPMTANTSARAVFART